MSYIMQISEDIEQNRRVLHCTGKLERCPRCGGEAVVSYALDYYHTPAIMAYCKECGAHTRKVGFLCSVLRKGESWHTVTESEAVAQVFALWNNRTLRERVKEI